MQPQTAKAPDVSVQDLADTTHVDSENAAYKNADGLSWGRTEESRRGLVLRRQSRITPKTASIAFLNARASLHVRRMTWGGLSQELSWLPRQIAGCQERIIFPGSTRQ